MGYDSSGSSEAKTLVAALVGPPQLMMSFTSDGQLDPALLKERDDLYSISTKEVGLVVQSLTWQA